MPLIEAQKSRRFEAIFSIYNTWLIRRFFHNVYVRIRPEALGQQHPVVLIANHSSWWDGLLAFQLNRTLLHHEAYVLMSETGLRRFRFFSKLGAFSVNRDSTADVKKSMQYAFELLAAPAADKQSPRALWLFPQGDIRHQDSRPLAFRPGLPFLLRRWTKASTKVAVLPVAMYYSFGLEQKPDVYIAIGPPIEEGQDPEATLTLLLDDMQREIIEGSPAHYTALLRGRASTSDTFLKLFGRDHITK